jgi:hypothetical protein
MRRWFSNQCLAAEPVPQSLEPIGTLTVCGLVDGEDTSKVTHAGPVTMMPPTKPVNRGPHTGSRTLVREAAIRAWPVGELISVPMRDDEP